MDFSALSLLPCWWRYVRCNAVTATVTTPADGAKSLRDSRHCSGIELALTVVAYPAKRPMTAQMRNWFTPLTMKNFIAAAGMVLVTAGAPVVCSAQDQAPDQAAPSDRAVNPAQPDFTLIGLPTTLKMPRFASAFRVT